MKGACAKDPSSISYHSTRRTVTAKQNMAKNRPRVLRLVAASCYRSPTQLPPFSLLLSISTQTSCDCYRSFSILRLTRPQLWSFARMCVTVKRSRTSSLKLCVFLFALAAAFPHFHNLRISFFVFLVPHQHLLSCGTRCLRSSKGLVTVLTWLLVRRISLSNQHHLSALNSKSGHNTHTQNKSKRRNSRKWP